MPSYLTLNESWNDYFTDFKSMSRAIVATKKKEKVVNLIADTGTYCTQSSLNYSKSPYWKKGLLSSKNRTKKPKSCPLEKY